MITLLLHVFIRDLDKTEKPEVRRACGVLCGTVGILLNVLLFAGKYLAGAVSGSIAITADAFNNLSDAASSVITLFGFRAAGKKADRGHPFGHGRAEYISGLGVAVLILLMGAELLKSAAEKILHPEPVEAGLLPVALLCASIGVKLYMGFYNRRIGERIASEAMKATAADSLSDCAATAAVLASMGISAFSGVNVDGWCGLLVAGVILYAGYRAVCDTLDPLLGQPPSREFVEAVRGIVLSRPEILGLHDLIVHDYGPGRRMISLHAEVNGNGNVFALHDVIDGIERELDEKLCCDAVIHMDPVEAGNEAVTALRKKMAAIVAAIYPGASIHDFRMVPGTADTELLFDVVLPFGFALSNEEVQRGIEGLVCANWENYRAVVRVEQSYV